MQNKTKPGIKESPKSPTKLSWKTILNNKTTSFLYGFEANILDPSVDVVGKFEV